MLEKLLRPLKFLRKIPGLGNVLDALFVGADFASGFAKGLKGPTIPKIGHESIKYAASVSRTAKQLMELHKLKPSQVRRLVLGPSPAQIQKNLSRLLRNVEYPNVVKPPRL